MHPESYQTNSKPEQAVKLKKTKKGLKILALVFVLGIVGLAGWKWYGQVQEYKTNQAALQQQISELRKQVASLKQPAVSQNDSQKTYTLDSLKTSFDYPSDWAVVWGTTEGSDSLKGVEYVYVTSPDKKIKIELNTGIDGLGGGCDEPDQSLEKTLSVTAMPNYKVGQPVSYVERIVKEKTSGKYYVGYGVANSQGQKVGEAQICPHLSYLVAESSAANSGISFGSGYTVLEGELSFETSQQAEAFFKTSDYAAAKKIVQSLRTN